jgi:hypothetical protein
VNDRVHTRALAALRFVDATTGAPIAAPLDVSAPGARFVRNRRGLHVVVHCDGLAGYDTAFPDALLPPDAPPLGQVLLVVTVRDRERRYLARTATVALPRDADPAHASDAGSVFQAVDIPLFPSPLAPSEPGWARVRASVRRTGTTTGVPRAFLRLRSASDPTDVLAHGLADERGEAFVPVAGIPVVNWSSDPEHPVLATSVDAVLEAYFDPAADEAPNPVDIDAHRGTLVSTSAPVSLASGREETVVLELALS